MATGLLPEGTELSERPQWIAAWDSLTDDERRLYARMMEVYAGFLEHTDAQVGRVLDFIEELGESENTIVVVMSDNGASAEGGPRGSFNEMYFFNGQPESLEENLKRIDDLGGPDAHNHYAWGWAWAGNTPLKRWKRETHEGGVADPLIVHWPSRLGQPGETRHQFVHAIDLLPTLLDVIGIEPPESIAGVPQQPFDGVSFAHTFADGAAASRHVTQYYEMLSCRAIYHDGWKAVTFHPLMLAPYDGSDPRRPFDEDPWELYHVAEDFAETTDLAEKEPDRLADMIELWWSEAERNQVLPITNMPGLHGDRRYRRNHYEYFAGISSLPDAVAPNLRNRSWQMTAEIDNSNGDAAGVIANHGSASGGYAVYVKDGRLCYAENFLGTETTIVRRGRRSAPVSAHGEVHLLVHGNIRRRRKGRAVPRRHAGGRRHDPAHHADLVRDVGVRSRLPAWAVDHDRLRRSVRVHARCARQGHVRRGGAAPTRCRRASPRRERHPVAPGPPTGSRE